MGIGTGAAALIAGAAPGVAQGVGNAMNSYQDFRKDQALDTNTQSQTGETTGVADASHPVWSFLNSLVGGSGSQPAQPAKPAAIPDIPAMQTPDIAQPQMGSMNQPVQALAAGGIVRNNYGIPTHQPGFVVGPQQGVTPASTEGQILTMDAGGVVPDGFHEQAGISGVPMNGGGAAFIQGMQAGQNLGHNIAQAWHERQARNATADYAGQVGAADSDGNPTGDTVAQQPGMLDQAKNAVEGFFKHIHDATLGDNHKPNADPSNATGAGPGIAAPPPAGPSGASPSPIPTGPASGAPPPAVAPAPANGAGPGIAAPPPADPGAAKAQAALQQNPVLGNVVQQIAKDPNVQQGIPDAPPEQSGKPHSLTPQYWSDLNRKKIEAVQAAARAGEDPAKVYESLTAMQNAHFQGQVLKQAATAANAFENGNMDAVAQALKNINYYLPNGQDIDVRKATAQDVANDPTLHVGDLVHTNPYAGMYGHEKDPTLIKVDLPYIQSLGQGALDPQKMQEAQMAHYKASMDAQKETLTAEGAYMTGQGKRMAGAAAEQNAQTHAALLPFDARYKTAAADNQEAQAGLADRKPVSGNNPNAPKVTGATNLAVQKAVATAVNSRATGELTSQPAMEPVLDKNTGKPVLGPDGKPLMQPSMSPAAGKTFHDPNNVGTLWKGMSPDRRSQVTTLAQQLAVANFGDPRFSPEASADMAARIYHQMDHPTTHPNPQTGKPEKDLVYDADGRTVHVWVGNQWVKANTETNVVDGAEPSPVQSGGGGGGGSGGDTNDTDSVLQD